MGLCSSTANADGPQLSGGGSSSGSAKKYHRKTEHDAVDVTEKRIENILKAKRRLVVSDQGGFEADASFVVPSYEKSGSAKKLIRSALEKNFVLFPNMTKKNQGDMVSAMQQQEIATSSQLMAQGDEGEYMYVVESGTFDVLVNDRKVKTCRAGDVIGELALLYKAPRAATVVCTSNSIVWSLHRTVFTNIIAQVASAEASDKLKILQKVELLSSLTPGQLSKVADALVSVQFSKGERIIKQGDVGDVFYIVQSGSVSCTDPAGGASDLALNAGDYFGELALMKNDTRARDVHARTKVNCLVLDRAAFDELLGNLKHVMDSNLGLRVLQTVPVFKTLNPNQRAKVVDAFEERTFHAGDTIIREGDQGESFFVVREGNGIVLKEGKKVGEIREGEFFGEQSLLRGELRSATVQVSSESLRCFELSKAAFEGHLGSLKKIIERTAATRQVDTELKTVKMNQLTFGRNLGQGTFGLVKLVTYKSPSGKSTSMALKCMQKQQITDYKLVRNVLYEKQMMVESDHPFVLKLFTTFQDADQLYMLLEIVPGGELFAYLQKRGGYVPTNHARFISSCVVSAFDYIHSKGICYRDLKPENLMIEASGYIKVVDFGFAKVVVDKTFTLCGTPEYMAPEILLRSGHGKGVDYWAVGILIYECETGMTPFADYENYDNRVICENILRKPLSFPADMNVEARGIITKLLQRKVTKRYGCLARGARDIMAHDYFKAIDFNKLLLKELKAPYVPKLGGKVIDESNFEEVEGVQNVEKYRGPRQAFASF